MKGLGSRTLEAVQSWLRYTPGVISLGIGNVKSLLRLTGEMLEIQSEAEAVKHGLSTMCALVGARVAVLAELNDFGPGGQGTVSTLWDHGWRSEAEKSCAVRPYMTLGCRADPIARKMMDNFGGEAPLSRQAFRRSDLIESALWYRSDFFNDARRPADLDHMVHCVSPIERSTRSADAPACVVTGVAHTTHPPEITLGVTFIRSLGEADFSEEECGMIALFQAEVLSIWKRHSAPSITDQLSLYGLSPRELQTAALLLTDAEPLQIALTLGVSRHTCHQYVKAIYKKCNVHSRAQLLQVMLRRQNGKSS